MINERFVSREIMDLAVVYRQRKFIKTMSSITFVILFFHQTILRAKQGKTPTENEEFGSVHEYRWWKLNVQASETEITEITRCARSVLLVSRLTVH